MSWSSGVGSGAGWGRGVEDVEQEVARLDANHCCCLLGGSGMVLT